MATTAIDPAMKTNATMAARGLAPQRPVTGPPAPNSDIFFFINATFRKEFEVCARLTDAYVAVTFEADLVKKLNAGETTTYSTTLRVPKGCIVRAQVHPIFRRFLVQSMWLQMQPAMLRYKGKGQRIDPKAPVCSCANPPCAKSAVRFVGNPGFFLQKSLLIDPYCIPVCGDTTCVLQAQHMSSTIHAQAQKPPPKSAVNPALRTQMPNSVKSCNTCRAFEQKYGGTAVMLRACPLCGLAYYCSQQCQIQDWQRGHKDICTNAKGRANGAGTAAKAPEQKSDARASTQTKPKRMSQQATIPEEDSVKSFAEEQGKTTKPTAPAPRTVPAPSPRPVPMPAAPPTTATSNKMMNDANTVATDANTIAELNELNDDLEDTADNLEHLEIEFAEDLQILSKGLESAFEQWNGSILKDGFDSKSLLGVGETQTAPAAAPAPSPAPVPVHASPAPAPAPRSKATQNAPPNHQMSQPTTRASAVPKVPTYKIPELAQQKVSTSLAVPKYNMPEPPAPSPAGTTQAGFTTPTYDTGVATKPTYATPTFQAPTFVAPMSNNDPGKKTGGSVPIRKGRKKAE